MTEPSELVTTSGLAALEGQYTLHSWGGARKIAWSMNGRSSTLHTLRIAVMIKNDKIPENGHSRRIHKRVAKSESGDEVGTCDRCRMSEHLQQGDKFQSER